VRLEKWSRERLKSSESSGMKWPGNSNARAQQSQAAEEVGWRIDLCAQQWIWSWPEG